MTKKNKTPLLIFMEALKLYFSNFAQFTKYMTFPVLGQIVGLSLVFLITYFYSLNLPTLIEKYHLHNNLNLLIILSIVIVLPGLAIFVKAFWEYLIAYGAINSMVENLLKSGKVYDFDAHTELIKRRTIAFVGLWFLYGIFSVIAICPLFWVVCAILAIYFVLIFQVFTFEPELSPIGCVKKSGQIIKGNFVSTFMLFALIGALTYIFIPQICNKIFDVSGITNFFATLILPIINQLPQPDFSSYGIPMIKPTDIAIFVIQTFVAQILIQYSLPMRSILWTLWYKNNIKTETNAVSKTTSGKRPSEKLMEASKKKYSGKKKIDRNILKRAMEKDEE